MCIRDSQTTRSGSRAPRRCLRRSRTTRRSKRSSSAVRRAAARSGAASSLKLTPHTMHARGASPHAPHARLRAMCAIAPHPYTARHARRLRTPLTRAPPCAPGNNIGVEGATAVAAALKGNSTLKTLYLQSAPRRRSLGRCRTPTTRAHEQSTREASHHTRFARAP
eukprot:5725382-Prymnesium_polylepis.1